jgi:hypothetical protein
MVGALTALVCFLVQIICILSITYIKVKYFLEEKKRKSLISKRTLPPIFHMDTNLSPELDLRRRENRLETVLRNGNVIRANNLQQHASLNEHIVTLNNSPYNKILIEVFQIGFVLLAMAINLTAFVVKKNLNNGESVYGYSQTLLCFLDLAPRILLSIVLPLAIHIRNPEIQKYTKGIF